MAGTAEYPVVMRAQLSVESLPCMPASAWAARPLASGARSKLIERRSVRCLGVGCPSCGGQRTVSGASSRTRAELVTSMQRRRPAQRGKLFSVEFNSQTARSAVRAAVAKAASTVQRRGAGLCHGKVAALGQHQNPEGPSSSAQPETPNAKSLHTQAPCLLAFNSSALAGCAFAFRSSPCSAGFA